ncbi:MAG: helix-turn-helix domain-containing protein [Clostridium sp.]|uniref:S24 family peptidase n=1 Tax=Clostridia TaxID=186801 RepID=UPI000AC6D071|nr:MULTISPECIES: S24 family peptidase [Clostridia]MBS6765231.1 helix-turn-helix domain-containing protein [Clostridium sp.]
MNFLEKLDFLMNKYGLNKRTLSQKCGIPYTTIDAWYKKGYEGLKLTTLRKLNDFFNTSLDYWILDEITDPNYGKSSGFEVRYEEMEHIKKYRSLDPHGQETVSYILDMETIRVQQINNAYKDGHSIIEYPTYFMTYYHNLASAGTGEYIFEDLPTDTIEVPVNELSQRADFVIGVNGDSMEPTYYDGEKVYVEKMQVLEIGDIGIFMINNECFIKEVGEDGLISHNPKYDIISGSENIECIGKVLGKVELSDPAKIQTLSSEGVRARNIGKTLLGNKNHNQKQK